MIGKDDAASAGIRKSLETLTFQQVGILNDQKIFKDKTVSFEQVLEKNLDKKNKLEKRIESCCQDVKNSIKDVRKSQEEAKNRSPNLGLASNF
jgi:hypothetical protein